MFDHNHHATILEVLKQLNVDLFKESRAYFGGGTLLAMLHNEYRWSQDIDFMCPVQADGYAHLRKQFYHQGYNALFAKGHSLEFKRAPSTDQYGIRFPIRYKDHNIKFEIVAEARIDLDKPAYYDWCPVPCLSINDCFVQKLLANVDRGNDKSFLHRDLIDLAVMRKVYGPIPLAAITKATTAYDDIVLVQLKRTLQVFQEDSELRRDCFERLQIDNENMIEIVDGLDLLANDLGGAPTPRTPNEESDLFPSQ
jgi:predicted nucleotidyltransferase component of viral defense system